MLKMCLLSPNKYEVGRKSIIIKIIDIQKQTAV